MSDEPLTIAKIFGGMTVANSEWEAELRWLTKSVRHVCTDVDVGLRINMQLQVPGPFLQPDFQGARWGRFSSKDNLLVVQVALPERPPPNVREYLLGRVLEGLDQAEAWARKRRRPLELSSMREAISTAQIVWSP